jgi:hypothetical protein
MTYLDLKSEIRADLWASGEGENLLTAHDNNFNEALADLTDCVECLQLNLTNVFPSCSTFFNCGMTVIPAPRGQILSVYTIGKGRCVDAASSESWCKKVYYEQVDYCHIQDYVKVSQSCNSSAIFAASNAIVNTLFGVFRMKRYYPAPTDEGLENLPPLPQGFHYPQTSTDLNRRSNRGVFAIYRGRIYIAPWIESTEQLVVEWNGKKTVWNDSDLVDDDIKFKQAVKAFVAWKHFLYYEENPQKMEAYQQEYQNIRRDLIFDCREQTRIRECSEAGTSGGASARGIGTPDGVTNPATSAFTNESQTYTASCPTGQTGDPVTVTIPAGTVGSSLSVADANAKAQAMAATQAQAQLSCSGATGTFLNTAQTYTANCAGASGDTPAASGNPVTVTIPAGQFQSTVSQAIADAAALAAAQAQAESQLVCTFNNAPQTASASCPDGTGTQTVTIPAGQFSSTVSQDDANSKAATEAQNEAAQALVDSAACATFLVWNTEQIVLRSGFLTAAGCLPKAYNFRITVPAHTIAAAATTGTQAAVQLQVNQQALDLANAEADAFYANLLRSYQITCGGLSGGGSSG